MDKTGSWIKGRRFAARITAALLYAAASAAPLAAQYQGFSLGLGAEGNSITLIDGWGLGGQIAAEARLFRRLALDFHIGASTFFSRNLDTAYSFVAMEAILYPRWYFFAPEEMAGTGVELFLGPGIGVLATVSNMNFRQSRGSPDAGVIAGARFRLKRNFYVEPYVRAGYPILFSAGVMAGLRFPAPARETVVVEKVVEKVVETKAEPIVETRVETVVETVEVEKPVKIEDTIFSVYFPPNSAQFDGLDEEIIAQNGKALEEIVRLLEENPSARLLIEGYANAVNGTEYEEWRTLMPLSGRRAAYVIWALADRGVTLERLITADWGGLHPAVPREDREHWGQNRRVDMRLLF